MKSYILILALLFSALCNAQYKTEFGLVGRVNVSTFRTGNTLRTNEIVANPEVGVNLRIPTSPGVAINIQGLYVQTGGRYGTFITPRFYDLRLRYAKLPVALSFGRGDFKLNLGYYEAYLLDKVTIGSTYANNYSFNSTHWIAHRSDRGLIGGFDVDLHGLVWSNMGSYGLRRVGKEGALEPLWNERNCSISSGLIYNF